MKITHKVSPHRCWGQRKTWEVESFVHEDETEDGVRIPIWSVSFNEEHKAVEFKKLADEFVNQWSIGDSWTRMYDLHKMRKTSRANIIKRIALSNLAS